MSGKVYKEVFSEWEIIKSWIFSDTHVTLILRNKVANNKRIIVSVMPTNLDVLSYVGRNLTILNNIAKIEFQENTYLYEILSSFLIREIDYAPLLQREFN